MSSEKIKRTRVRKEPYKRWTDYEHKLLIEFLNENKPIEKPTAQIYYTRFAKKNQIEVDWGNIRCKVRNLRDVYKKALNLPNPTEDGLWQDENTIQGQRLKICPLFNDLRVVFGNLTTSQQRPVNTTLIERDDDTIISIQNYQSNEDISINVKLEDDYLESISPSPSHNASKRIYSYTPLSETLDMQANMNELRDNNMLDLEVRRRKHSLTEQQFALEHERFLLEKEIKQREIYLKEKELESKEKIQILELEMKERIALKEIESKEKLALEELNMRYGNLETIN
ncbi:uncharacterized protein LOC119669807 [Teleopsis dalmanni]|uniref:uncharacterized protein LOC119667994 n=1 Tax=Teleopsis dalmanni TaxID=139649 RepID=UPI0018CE1841|nr:uncharacterized protein LOC119667994 [Teleopsis dalmanni]XP_037935762.1 uncharacterized protein LOC119669807 [Teleopsis dalmanni]